MKILQIFGAVVAVHLLAFIFIFASPGCQSGPRTVPTPDATMPTDSAPAPAPITFNSNATPQPVDLGTAPGNSSGHNVPTRPGSPNAAAVAPSHAEEVAPVSTYTIAKGDSLWSVAKKNHLSVSELAKANNLPTGAALKPGKKLIIPGKAPAPAAVKETATAPASVPTAKSSTAAPASSSTEVVKHTVASGESLGVIARKYQISVGELAAANNITDPSKVRAGQQLIIPGGKAVAPKNTAATPAHASAGKPASSSSPATTSTTPPASTPTPASTPATAAPHYEVTAPPPGQDLDAGLKENTTEVPTIKVEDATEKK